MPCPVEMSQPRAMKSIALLTQSLRMNMNGLSMTVGIGPPGVINIPAASAPFSSTLMTA